jgi:hypothetical protein
MKIIKKIVIVLAILIAIPLIAALFVKGEYSVERHIDIAKPKQTVFEYIKLLKNQDNYSKWARMDPAMKKEYRGTDGTVGFVAAWDSDKKDVGKGEQEIKGIDEGKRLDFELRFLKPFKATDYAYMTTDSTGDSLTTVKWGFNGKMPYPMNVMCLFMNMDKMLGPDLQMGLDTLKAVLEKK